MCRCLSQGRHKSRPCAKSSGATAGRTYDLRNLPCATHLRNRHQTSCISRATCRAERMAPTSPVPPAGLGRRANVRCAAVCEKRRRNSRADPRPSEPATCHARQIYEIDANQIAVVAPPAVRSGWHRDTHTTSEVGKGGRCETREAGARARQRAPQVHGLSLSCITRVPNSLGGEHDEHQHTQEPSPGTTSQMRRSRTCCWASGRHRFSALSLPAMLLFLRAGMLYTQRISVSEPQTGRESGWLRLQSGTPTRQIPSQRATRAVEPARTDSARHPARGSPFRFVKWSGQVHRTCRRAQTPDRNDPRSTRAGSGHEKPPAHHRCFCYYVRIPHQGGPAPEAPICVVFVTASCALHTLVKVPRLHTRSRCSLPLYSARSKSNGSRNS